MPTASRSWLRLGGIPSTALVASRLELHWAAQLPAALGIARATPTADFAQHALTWDDAHEYELPPLPAPMEWVTDGWIGAVLRGSRVAERAPGAQAELVAGFYRRAVEALAT